MFLTFLVSGAFVLITLGSNVLINHFESLPQVTAFLKDGTTSATVEQIRDKLTATNVVSETRYVSKEEALNIYRERFKNEPLLTNSVTADILPASIEVSTYRIGDLSKVAGILKNEPAVEDVEFQENIVATLSSWVSTIRNVGGGVVTLLLLTAFLTTLIVIGLNISIHQDEIEIMRLVGATNWYIRTPFILEGVFYGVFSALAATGFILLAVFWARQGLQVIFAGAGIFPISPFVYLYLLVGEVLVGVLMGVVGSLVATRKYLRV
jgi:cell division protein FtsX